MFITMTMPHTTFRPWRRWRPWLSVVPLCVSIHALAQRPSRSSLRVEKVRGSGRSVLLGRSQTFANSFGRWCIVSLCYAIYVWICAQLWKMILLMFSCTATSHSLNSLQCSNISSGRFPNFKQGWKHQFTNWGSSIPENPESRRYQIYWALTTCIGALDAMNPCSCYWRLESSWVFHVFFRVSGDELVKDKYFLAISSRPPPGTLKINETCWSEPVHLSSNMPWVLGRTKMNQVKRGSKLWNSPCSNMFITQVNHAGWSENGAYRKIP